MATETATRTRTITWDDPAATAGQALELDGLTFLQRMRDGHIPPPPIAHTMGFEGFDVERGRATFRVRPAEYHYNPIGTVHGGLAATLADSALGCAVQSTLPAGIGYTTVDLRITYVRPITAGTGLVTCTAEVVHVGRRVATAEARVTDESGRLLAHASTTCLVLTPDGGAR